MIVEGDCVVREKGVTAKAFEVEDKLQLRRGHGNRCAEISLGAFLKKKTRYLSGQCRKDDLQ